MKGKEVRMIPDGAFEQHLSEAERQEIRDRVALKSMNTRLVEERTYQCLERRVVGVVEPELTAPRLLYASVGHCPRAD